MHPDIYGAFLVVFTAVEQCRLQTAAPRVNTIALPIRLNYQRTRPAVAQPAHVLSNYASFLCRHFLLPGRVQIRTPSHNSNTAGSFHALDCLNLPQHMNVHNSPSSRHPTSLVFFHLNRDRQSRRTGKIRYCRKFRTKRRQTRINHKILPEAGLHPVIPLNPSWNSQYDPKPP